MRRRGLSLTPDGKELDEPVEDPDDRPRIRGALPHHVVTSIPALLLFQPVLDDPVGYIAGGGSDTRIHLGVLLEMLLIVSNVGTAV